MKVFFGKHYGKDVSELDSSYIVWIIENYENCEFLLREACKSELSHRLGLNFEPPSESEAIYFIETLRQKKLINALNTKLDHLEKLICMAIICKGNKHILDGYMSNLPLLKSDLNIIKQINQ